MICTIVLVLIVRVIVIVYIVETRRLLVHILLNSVPAKFSPSAGIFGFA